jgi:hypothetical protein
MQNRLFIGMLARGALAMHPRQPILVEATGKVFKDAEIGSLTLRGISAGAGARDRLTSRSRKAGCGSLRRSRRLAGGPR